nr:hypothetical protein [uncultured Draconibacterium sp.]
MADSNNTTNGGFRKAWGMLPADEQPKIREKIKETCGWASNTTFSQRLNGHSEFRPLEVEALKAIFAAWNIDFEKAEYIKQLAQ